MCMEVLLVWHVYGGVVSLACVWRCYSGMCMEVLLFWHVYGGVVSLACMEVLLV